MAVLACYFKYMKVVVVSKVMLVPVMVWVFLSNSEVVILEM